MTDAIASGSSPSLSSQTTERIIPPKNPLPEGVASAILFCHTPTAVQSLADERGRSSLPTTAHLPRAGLPDVPSKPASKTLEQRVTAPIKVGRGVLTEALFPSAHLCGFPLRQATTRLRRTRCAKTPSVLKKTFSSTNFKTPIPFVCFTLLWVKDSSLLSSLAKIDGWS